MSDQTTSDDGTGKAPLFFQRRFLPMWTGFVLGAFADNMLRQALIIGISFGVIMLPGFERGQTAIPIVGSFFAIAMLLFSSISGQISDKYETAMLFRRIKFVEVVLMAIAAIGFYTQSGVTVVLTLFAMGAQSAFFSPVRIGAMPKYLKTEELVRGNAFCNAGLFVAILAGLFIGGVLIEQPGGPMRLSICLFAASLTGWLAILAAPKAAPTAPDLTLDFNIPKQALRILSFAFEAPGVARPLLGAAAFYYMSTLVTVLTPIYAREIWGAGGGVANAIMGIFALGAGAGAMSAAAIAGKRTGLGVAGAGVGASCLAVLLIYFLGLGAPAPAPDGGLRSVADFFALPRISVLCGAFAASAAALGLFMVPMQAAAQRRAPPERRARILAAGNMLNAIAAIAGSLSVLAVTNAGLAPDVALLFVAVLQGALAVYMTLRWRAVPQGLYDAPDEAGSMARVKD